MTFLAFQGFITHYCAKPFEQVWKVTAFTRLWFLINSTIYPSCLLEKSSATAGLGGFTLREAARGAFQLEEFPMMEDPLVVEEKYGSIVKEVSQVLNIMNFSNIYVEHVKRCKVLCINCYRQRKGMRR